MQPRLRENSMVLRQTGAEAVHASPVASCQPPVWRSWLRNLAIAGAAGAFLAFVGAMDTGTAPFHTRLAYWVPLMVAGGMLGNAVALLAARIPHARMNPWLFGAVVAAAMTLPSTLLVWGYTDWIFDLKISVASLPVLFGSVLVICAAMTAVMVLANWPGRTTRAPNPAGEPVAVRFLERIPAKLKGSTLFAVSAEDHYLRLHTSKGSELILMRLADALDELEGLDGAQTHRSWWVARCAVEGARRQGDRAVLLLKGGLEAPVSRPNVRHLHQAGWF